MMAPISGKLNRPRDALVAGRHTVGQARQDAACGGFTQRRNDRVNARGTCRNQKPKRETCGKGHVLEVGFINSRRMRCEDACNHPCFRVGVYGVRHDGKYSKNTPRRCHDLDG